MKDSNALWICLASIAMASGCGGSPQDEEPVQEEQTAGDETTTTDEAGPIAWADMSMEQRGAFMNDTVMPEMRAMFQEFDGERYAEFNCSTCHGDNAQEVGFEMPNGLAPLDPSQIGAMFQSDQPMAQFMTQRVWPRMAELLQEEPFNPETGQGFSCLNCHATQGG